MAAILILLAAAVGAQEPPGAGDPAATVDAFHAALAAGDEDRRTVGQVDAACVLTRTESSANYRGRQVAARGAGTMVLGRAEDGGRIVHSHWSSRSAD